MSVIGHSSHSNVGSAGEIGILPNSLRSYNEDRCESPALDTLPDDVLSEVFGRCRSVTDAANLRSSSRSLNRAYLDHEIFIVRRIISQQYPSSSELYCLAATLKHNIVAGPGAMYIDTPLKVFFRNDSGQFSTLVLLATSNERSRRSPRNVILGPQDLAYLVHICRTIDHWISVFPLLRFKDCPPGIRRILRRSEELRLGRAILRWWKYSLHFQGKLRWHMSIPWDSCLVNDESYDPEGVDEISVIDTHSAGVDEDRNTLMPAVGDEGGNAPSSYQSTLSLSTSSSGSPSLAPLSYQSSDENSFNSVVSLQLLISQGVSSPYSHQNEHVPEFEAVGPDRSTGRAFMRTLCTTHLMELRDLISCVYDMVASDLCPSREHLQRKMKTDTVRYTHSTRIHGWGRECTGQNFVIVNTYLKLPPDDLLVLWQENQGSPSPVSAHFRSRQRLRALSMVPGLGLTRQSLTTSLDYVLRERYLVDMHDGIMLEAVASNGGLNNVQCGDAWDPPRASCHFGGILDFAGAAVNESSVGHDKEVSGHGLCEAGRYDSDAIPSGEKPDYSLAWPASRRMERLSWKLPKAGWTLGHGLFPGPLVLKGDDGSHELLDDTDDWMEYYGLY